MQEPARAKQEIGGLVPEFTLALLGGQVQTLESILAGRRGAVVLFWSGVCSHCIRYDGYLNEFSSRHPAIALAAIASRHGETAPELREKVGRRQLQFPILHDPQGAVARAYFAVHTPSAYLIDADRRLLYRGAIDNFKYPQDPDYQSYLEPAIEAFLGGGPISRAETSSFGCAIHSVYYQLSKPF